MPSKTLAVPQQSSNIPEMRYRNLFAANHPLRQCIAIAVSRLAVTFNRPPSPELLEIYADGLEMLTPEQLTTAFSRAELEQQFWPPVAVLRHLAGVPTTEEKNRAEAIEALDWVLAYLRKHGVEHRPTQGPTQASLRYMKPSAPPDNILRTCQQLGAGDGQAGLELMAKHPTLALRNGESGYENAGKLLWAQKDFEAMWVEAYRRANGGAR